MKEKSILLLSCTISAIIFNDGISQFVYELETEDTSIIKTPTTTAGQVQIFKIPEEKWTMTAVQNIAYFLRSYKFNEWDRRYEHKKPKGDSIGFFKAFAIPPLASLHWEVYENCYDNFYKCVIYLHSIIETAPLTRSDDTTTIINKYKISNKTEIESIDNVCNKAFSNAEKSGLPFESSIEKFQWSTTAFYYMCWYTLLGTPELSMLGETCDNFANCLDIEFGPRNHDPRSEDRLSFACAKYSFCPDPCCPVKHINNLKKCNEDSLNPCFVENSGRNYLHKKCRMNSKENHNFKDLVANKWNVSCNCKESGFRWKSRFGICVDINECVTENRNCDNITEDCLNLPGTFRCICTRGYEYDERKKKCVEAMTFLKTENSFKEPHYSFWEKLKHIYHFFF